MNEFKNCHPAVNFAYFTVVILFSMFFMNPMCLMISVLCSFIYSVMLKGMRAVKFNLVYMLPLFVFSALINPAFNHKGMTILTYLPSGNPLTLESIIYGLAAAGMIVSVICWFSCYNAVMTSDKFIYLFGKIIPSLSLVLSMMLRFIPRFNEHLREVRAAQKGIGADFSSGNILKRFRNGVKIMSAMLTWAFENSVETADSMKSRGYGLPGRTAFSIYSLDKRDVILLLYIMFLAVYIIFGSAAGGLYFSYFPALKGAELSLFGASLFCAYFMICITPVVIEIWEMKKWKSIEQKI